MDNSETMETRIVELLEGEPTFSHILKCVLGITPSEIEVYMALFKHPDSGVDEIAESIDKDRSGVYRSLQSLLEKGLVERDYRILKQGGYKYLYKPIPVDELKNRLKNELRQWYKKLSEIVNGFELE
jgi:predicted transcriptional regulator